MQAKNTKSKWHKRVSNLKDIQAVESHPLGNKTKCLMKETKEIYSVKTTTTWTFTACLDSPSLLLKAFATRANSVPLLSNKYTVPAVADN